MPRPGRAPPPSRRRGPGPARGLSAGERGRLEAAVRGLTERELPGLALPGARRCGHFVNLTNGLEAVPWLEARRLPYTFTRLQSTQCERANADGLLRELDTHLLLQLALGNTCLLYDFGSRSASGVPRSVWYGLELVKFALSYLWFDEKPACYLHGHLASEDFERRLLYDVAKSTKKRLRYFRKYLGREEEDGGDGGGRIKLLGVCRATAHDQDDAFYNGIVDGHVRGQPRPPGDESEDMMQMLDEADFTLHVRGFSHNELRAALGGYLRGNAPA